MDGWMDGWMAGLPCISASFPISMPPLLDTRLQGTEHCIRIKLLDGGGTVASSTVPATRLDYATG